MTTLLEITGVWIRLQERSGEREAVGGPLFRGTPPPAPPTAGPKVMRGSLTQIVVVTVLVRVLSTPSAEYEVSAKYQVPEARPVTL